MLQQRGSPDQKHDKENSDIIENDAECTRFLLNPRESAPQDLQQLRTNWSVVTFLLPDLKPGFTGL